MDSIGIVLIQILVMFQLEEKCKDMTSELDAVDMQEVKGYNKRSSTTFDFRWDSMKLFDGIVCITVYFQPPSNRPTHWHSE